MIPVVKAGDPRFETRGDVTTPVVNMRMRVSLEAHPGFALDLGGREAAWAAADIIRQGLSDNYKKGRDARGNPLPPLSPSTIARRKNRQIQWVIGMVESRAAKHAGSYLKGKGMKHARRTFKESDAMSEAQEALRERFRLRGKSPSGKRQYQGTDDVITPFRESGLAAENVYVFWKGYNKTTGEGRGDPEVAIAWPTGGKERGLNNDDGRGARLFAVMHYGFDRMADIPTHIERELDQMLDNYLSRLLLVGRAPISVLRQLGALGQEAAAVVDDAVENEPLK